MKKPFFAALGLWACLSGLLPNAHAQTQTADPNKPLTLTTQPSDFTLQFDWLATGGATPSLSLPNGQTLPLQNARVGKAPGLWQTTQINYRAGQNGQPAMLVKLAINGVTLQEGQNLVGGRAMGQPVQLAVQAGSATIRNVLVRAMANRSVASWAGPLTYKVYKEGGETREGLASKTPIKTGTVNGLDFDAVYGQPGRYSVFYDGKLNVPTAGDYVLDLNMGGVAGLWIDGKAVVPMTYHDLGDPESRTVPLAAGDHDVQVMFARSWPRPGLGLFISQPDTRPQPLHTPGSLPEITPVSAVVVQPETRPTLIRSFVQLPGEKTKRTHALSVGTPSGMHYSFDLNQMALILAWKGDFADMTQSWHERGEPQLLQPVGVVVRPSPRTAIAPLANAAAAWPDSVDEKTLQYKGLLLDKEGNPTAEYVLAGATVRDQVRPSGNVLARTLTINGNASAPLYCRLAAGKSLEEVAKGVYAIDDRSYFVRFDPKAAVSVRQSNGQQELVMPVALKNGAATVNYSLEF